MDSRRVVPMAVLRASSIASSSSSSSSSGDGSCRTDAEEPSTTTDTSPAATPPRPYLATASDDCDPMSMLAAQYDAFPHDGEAEDEEAAAGQEQPRRRQQQPQAMGPNKRLRCATPNAGTTGLVALPGECLREVARFLPAADIWPALALVCKRVSCHPALVPLLADACPRALLPGAVFGMWTAGPQEQEQEQAPAPCRDVRTLDLARLPLGGAGGRQLARAFSTAADGLSGLRSLDLAGCGMDGAGVEALVRALGQLHPPHCGPRMLESLRLSVLATVAWRRWAGRCGRGRALGCRYGGIAIYEVILL
jgi:hypothetical protein